MWFEFPSKEDQFGSKQVRGITDHNGEVFGELRGVLPVKLTQVSGNCGFTSKSGESTNWVVYDATFDKTGFLHLKLEKYYSKTIDPGQYYLTDLQKIDTALIEYRRLKERYAARNSLLDQDRDELFYWNFSKEQKMTYIQELKAEIRLLDQRIQKQKLELDSLKVDNLKRVYCKKSMELNELWKQKRELTISVLENELKPQPALNSQPLRITEFSTIIIDKQFELDLLKQRIMEEKSRERKQGEPEMLLEPEK